MEKCSICGKPIKDGEIGKTCQNHQGKVRQFAETVAEAPQGWINMAAVCRAGLEKGIKIATVVKAAGGDACTEPPIHPVFTVVYAGKRKYLHPDVMTEGLAMLENQPQPTAKSKPVQVDAKADKAATF